VVPGNIHTQMPRAASWNSKGEGGDYIEWNSEYMGGGGVMGLDFQRFGEVSRRGIKVCKWSPNCDRMLN